MEGLAEARKRRDGTLSHFSGALAALRYVEEVTEEEEVDWRNRMREALGIDPPRNVLQVVLASPVARPVARSTTAPPPPQFVRSLPGPDTEFERHGGRLRVLAVEIYDTVVSIRWRMAPEPDIDAVFASEAAQLARDVEGLDDWAAAELRKKAGRRMHQLRLFVFSLRDDVGTDYLAMGGGAGSGNNETSGDARFVPAPPSSARALTLTWFDVGIDIPLA
jgi:hypothetical protein